MKSSTLVAAAISALLVAPVGTHAAHYRVLHNFNGSDGRFPEGALTLDAAGNAYGTAPGGGANDHGVVFRMTPDGNVTVVYSFTGGSDGDQVFGNLAIDPANGDLYGTTFSGGASGFGVVYKVTTGGRQTVLHDFDGAKDGQGTAAGLARDRAGNLYGTTPVGGRHGHGTIFRVGSDGKFKVLYAFKRATGTDPLSRLKMDAAGNLYGTALFGGIQNAGTVFKLAPDGIYTVLHYFMPRAGDGQNPVGGLARDMAGNLYGTTEEGTPSGGIAFKLAPDSTETILHGFTGVDGDGGHPEGDLRHKKSGAVYGTTVLGGKFNDGIVFRIASDGTETILHSFNAKAGDGANPHVGLTKAPNGGFYGVTDSGGANGIGTIFWVND